MQWEGIREFVYVAEQESFTQASKLMAISTAQVSRQISALEQRLNVKLFYRTTRKVSLTQEGTLFYQHCRSALDGLEEAERALTNLQAIPQGKIKISMPTTYGEQQILPLLNDFVLNYTNIDIDAHLTNRRVDLIEEGYDLAIRLGKLSDSTMMARKLSKRTSYLCASPAYLDRYGTPHSISELNNHTCLVGTLDYWRFMESGKEKRVRITAKLRYNSGLGLIDAALKGIGIAQLPNYYVQHHLENGELISLLENFQVPDEGVWAVYPQNRQLSPKIKLLVEFLYEKLK